MKPSHGDCPGHDGRPDHDDGPASARHAPAAADPPATNAIPGAAEFSERPERASDDSCFTQIHPAATTAALGQIAAAVQLRHSLRSSQPLVRLEDFLAAAEISSILSAERADKARAIVSQMGDAPGGETTFVVTKKRGRVVRRKRCWRWVAAASFALGLASGCQTWVPEACLTLPAPRYLRHLPQYIPPSPQFPLPKESATLEEAQAQQLPGAMPPGGR